LIILLTLLYLTLLNLSTNRFSNLHLINWSILIVDIEDQTNIKSNSAKGLSLKSVNAHRKLGVFFENSSNCKSKIGLLAELFKISPQNNLSALTYCI
jgi:hypothetical protein